MAFPAMIATLHVMSDSIDVSDYNWTPALTIRLAVETLLLLLVWFVVLNIIRNALQSSILLNGWYLASKYVWIDEWDETTADPATRVKVNLWLQTAEPA